MKQALEAEDMKFELKTDRGYELVFDARSFDSKEWLDSYSISLSSPNMKGAVRVYNHPYGTSPHEFFNSIARDWKGWSGEKSWGSLDGEFDLTAESDRTGHISIRARIFEGHNPPSAQLETRLILEAGQCENVAKEATKFFLK